MKKLFAAIRKKENDTLREILAKKPELVRCTAKQPPKKDDGQSPLQVAFKTGNFEAANLLLDLGADVNFMEDESCCNDWRAPVLCDAITAAVMCCRHNSHTDLGTRVLVREHSSRERADEAFAALKRVLELGADVTKRESYGTTAAERLCVTAEQILPRYSWGQHKAFKTAVVTPEWQSDLSRIVALLREYGADFSPCERYYSEEQHPLRPFLAPVFER